MAGEVASQSYTSTLFWANKFGRTIVERSRPSHQIHPVQVGLPCSHGGNPTDWETNEHVSASSHCHPPLVGWPQSPNGHGKHQPGGPRHCRPRTTRPTPGQRCAETLGPLRVGLKLFSATSRCCECFEHGPCFMLEFSKHPCGPVSCIPLVVSSFKASKLKKPSGLCILAKTETCCESLRIYRSYKAMKICANVSDLTIWLVHAAPCRNQVARNSHAGLCLQREFRGAV